jgi:predicted amidophosphoribosyltransferase
MQAAAQVNQLHEHSQQVDWTRDVNYRDQAVGRCPSCMNETGGGKFCQHCGTPLAAAPAQQKRFCSNCGTPSVPGAMFCAECGQSSG